MSIWRSGRPVLLLVHEPVKRTESVCYTSVNSALITVPMTESEFEVRLLNELVSDSANEFLPILY